MSNLQSPLNGASYEGLIHIQEAGLRGMITLRGDLSDIKVKNAATGVAGVDMPGMGEARCVDERAICWMSPDELLITAPYGEVAADMAKMENTLGTSHHLIANVSDARAVFILQGDKLRDVLAKLTPTDMSPEACPVLAMKRTRFAQVPAAFWFRSDTQVELICFRSVAQYMFDLLKAAADPNADVGYFS
ncbi:sarcosine oxidase subunit gamma [Algirhabdus cladophorae]|uniref:sarcosine oxidase subunit gamma n=1 Tax=Algirhabdus cladophorae TaxID=3377108 RepID=UPI003B8489F8